MFCSLLHINSFPEIVFHREESKKTTGIASYLHRKIADIESLPLIGTLAVIIERIIQVFKKYKSPSREKRSLSLPLHVAVPVTPVIQKSFSPPDVPVTAVIILPGAQKEMESKKKLEKIKRSANWVARTLPLQTCFEKMHKNALKALAEMKNKFPSSITFSHDTFLSVPELLKIQKTAKDLKPLTYKWTETSVKGERLTNQDAHFCHQTNEGLLFGIFDGHGSCGVTEYGLNYGEDEGAKIAHRVANNFKEGFFKKLKEKENNVHQTFEALCYEISKQTENEEAGTTAFISFVDYRTHLVYSATLGDTEALILRKVEEKLRYFPISCLRDFGSEKDALRVGFQHPSLGNPKYRRYNSSFGANEDDGVNVARGFGDASSRRKSPKPNCYGGVISKPKITVNQVLPGDRIVVYCDGYGDFIEPKDTVLSFQSNPSLTANDLARAALAKHTWRNYDNVTVITIEVS